MSNTKYLVSIIMNCYNGEKYLTKSIRSVINQSYNNWELIFWDNQSDDNSEKLIKSLKDNRIKYFRSKKFTSLYEARNLAIKKAKGSFICFLDTDDWWVKKKIERQINFIKKNKNVNFIFSNLYIYDQSTKVKKLYFNYNYPSGKITQLLLNDYKLGILTVMIKRSFFLKKKFNKNFNIIGDFDFFIDLSLKENLFCINEPLAFYRIHKKNLSLNLNVYINELGKWLKINSKKFKKKNISLLNIYYIFYKLRIKNFLKLGH